MAERIAMSSSYLRNILLLCMSVIYYYYYYFWLSLLHDSKPLPDSDLKLGVVWDVFVSAYWDMHVYFEKRALDKNVFLREIPNDFIHALLLTPGYVLISAFL